MILYYTLAVCRTVDCQSGCADPTERRKTFPVKIVSISKHSSYNRGPPTE